MELWLKLWWQKFEGCLTVTGGHQSLTPSILMLLPQEACSTSRLCRRTPTSQTYTRRMTKVPTPALQVTSRLHPRVIAGTQHLHGDHLFKQLGHGVMPPPQSAKGLYHARGFFMNNHPTGASHSNMKLVCKHMAA